MIIALSKVTKISSASVFLYLHMLRGETCKLFYLQFTQPRNLRIVYFFFKDIVAIISRQ